MSGFRDEIVGGLEKALPFQELVEIVEIHKAQGLTQQAAYDVLESIWMEHGCQELGEEESAFCGLLGGLLDRVWGYCSSKDAIWDTSLSGKQMIPFTPKTLS